MCHAQKLYRIGDSIFGMAGDVMLALAFIEWLKGKQLKATLYKTIPESMRSDFDVLELSPEGLALWNGWGIRLPLMDATYAIGSGAMSALQAMRLQCSPERAILQTFPLDECTGVYASPSVEYLLPPELARKRKR
jgi:hypothetical protein